MKTQATVAVLLILAVTGTALAAPIGTATINVTGNYPIGWVVNVWGAGLSGQYIDSGFYILNKTAGTGAGTLIPNGLIKSACVQLTQYSSGISHVYDVIDPADAPIPGTYVPGGSLGTAKKAYLSELFGRYYSTASTTPSLAETFSVCVWEIEYEPLPASPAGWNVTSGSIRFGYTNTTTANQWLHSLDGTGPMTNLYALTNSNHQDYLVPGPDVGVPEPATLALLGCGLGMLKLIRRRRAAA